MPVTPRLRIGLHVRWMPAVFLALALSGCATLGLGPVGNPAVPQPARAVDLGRYVGLWYEIGRYENPFERGCEAVTASYSLREDSLVGVVNSCREGAPDGPERSIEGGARVVEGSGNAKLKVSFFGPFFVGDYWVLDRAEDYSWAIVGEPSGRFLWLLSRDAQPSETTLGLIRDRTAELGYDLSLIRPVRHR
jgi:apolipoprotein D and lipocalin family protein